MSPPIYNTLEVGAAHEEHTRDIFAQWQEYLAEIASIPWVIGGDWNIEPSEAEHHSDRRQARLLDVGAATQMHGRDIDGVIASWRTPT